MRFLVALLTSLLLAVPVPAQEDRMQPGDDVVVGYLSLENDPRYAQDYAYARIELFPQGDALAGARLAIEDMKIVSDARGFNVILDDASAADDAELEAAAHDMVEAGAAYIVLDLPAARADALAAGLSDTAVTLINATARADTLRSACHANLLHTAASYRMIGDALAQFLRQQDWTDILMLVGKLPRDQAMADAFRASAERLRLNIVESKPFDLSTNPELRDENNVRLLTAGTGRYDVVYLADTDGEFGRYVPYQTNLPRPVLGTTGLLPLDWHWSLERYGAPQVNSRFHEMTNGRRMVWQDWATWVATRAVITAYAKSRERSPEGIRSFLISDDLTLDGSKGVPQSFRAWNGQMRMPIPLVTSDAAITYAPLEGFLHDTNVLDTLGVDRAESSCG